MELSRIGVTCFAASYGLALAHELARVYWPRRLLRWLATGFAIAGVLAQTLFLLAIVIGQERLPIQSQFESLIAVAWLLALVYVYFLLRDRRLAGGLFVLPVVLGLVLFAGVVADRQPRPSDVDRQTLAIAHGMLLLVGTVFVASSLVSAAMYLVKVRQLKSGTWDMPRLPSLERLERANALTIQAAWPLLTAGILLGFSLRRLSLVDPKVLSTVVAWLLFTVLVHWRHQPAHRGRKLAMLTIVAAALVLFSVLGDPLFGTAHQSVHGAGP